MALDQVLLLYLVQYTLVVVVDLVQLIIIKQVEQVDLVVEVEEKQIHLIQHPQREQLIQEVVVEDLLIIHVDHLQVEPVDQESWS